MKVKIMMMKGGVVTCDRLRKIRTCVIARVIAKMIRGRIDMMSTTMMMLMMMTMILKKMTTTTMMMAVRVGVRVRNATGGETATSNQKWRRQTHSTKNQIEK